MELEPGRAYSICYTSRSGRYSARTIEVREVRRGGGAVYLRAWCRLRGEERTFRADRILSVVPLATPAAPSTVAPKASETPIRGEPSFDTASADFEAEKTARSIRRLLGAIVMMLIVGAVMISRLQHELLQASGSYSSQVSTAVVPIPKPAPVRPAIEEATVGGRLLRTVRSGISERYEVPSLGLSTADKMEAIAAIRIPNFRAATGLVARALEARYLAADLNRSGKLAFEELKAFQDKTWREFRYESNELALRPDEFLAAGGGDCEDFALYTAGLLRFWGWEPYLGVMAASYDAPKGHAICLSYEEGSFPASYTWFQLAAGSTPDGTPLKPGRYVPIDYDHVGGLSEASSPGWKLQRLYVPEAAWKRKM